jgi:hypothetical protein
LPNPEILTSEKITVNPPLGREKPHWSASNLADDLLNLYGDFTCSTLKGIAGLNDVLILLCDERFRSEHSALLTEGNK